MSRLHSLIQVLTHPTPANLLIALALLVVGVSALTFLTTLDITAVFAIGIALECFSGNWKYIPFPIPLDRACLAFGFLLLILRGTRRMSLRRIVLRPVHFLLFAVVAYVGANALAAGTLTGSHGFYALLDRLGVIPFLMYTLAPTLFGLERKRNILLVAMVALGLYLGTNALFQGVGLNSLVLPHYITNNSIGITTGRSRGPFIASDAMGLALFDCSVFAVIALTVWKDRYARLLCYLVVFLGALGILLTLTRSSWIGSVLGTVVAMMCHPRLRRHVVKVLVGGAVGVGVALVAIPGLASKAGGRAGTTASVWDRYNTNDAAIRAVEAKPLFGIGWQTFETSGIGYLREAATYPLTGEGLEVHNVFLSHFAELGVVGALLWILALLTAVGGAIVRPGRPELFAWKVGLIAIFTMFLVVANLVPLSYPLPNLLLWLTAGIVSIDRNSVSRITIGDIIDPIQPVVETPNRALAAVADRGRFPQGT
jgi:putative inorganic carbon (HCO3(-)) transporter